MRWGHTQWGHTHGVMVVQLISAYSNNEHVIGRVLLLAKEFLALNKISTFKHPR